MKKPMPMILAAVILLVIAGAVFALKPWKNTNGDAQQEAGQKKKVAEPVNVIDVAARPYLQIAPVDARNLKLTVIEAKLDSTQMEYELEYQAGSLLQGAFGLIELESLPASTQILLGSCSAGGACTYHEDIKGGTLLARFSGGQQDYAVKQDWRYFDNTDGESQVASRDGKFQLESAALEDERYLVVYNSPGYPEGLEGTPVSEFYTISGVGTLSGEATATIRANEGGELTMMGWDGNAWEELETTVEDEKVAVAEGALMELYVVVK